MAEVGRRVWSKEWRRNYRSTSDNTKQSWSLRHLRWMDNGESSRYCGQWVVDDCHCLVMSLVAKDWPNSRDSQLSLLMISYTALSLYRCLVDSGAKAGGTSRSIASELHCQQLPSGTNLCNEQSNTQTGSWKQTSLFVQLLHLDAYSYCWSNPSPVQAISI